MSSLEKCLFRSSAHFLIFFFFLSLSCMSCLYILEIKPFSVASFAAIFSQSIGGEEKGEEEEEGEEGRRRRKTMMRASIWA